MHMFEKTQSFNANILLPIIFLFLFKSNVKGPFSKSSKNLPTLAFSKIGKWGSHIITARGKLASLKARSSHPGQGENLYLTSKTYNHLTNPNHRIFYVFFLLSFIISNVINKHSHDKIIHMKVKTFFQTSLVYFWTLYLPAFNLKIPYIDKYHSFYSPIP